MISDDIAGAVAKLKDEIDGDILVNGSVSLIPALLEAGLVDEWRLMVFPTVLGAGKKLFADTPEATGLKLTDSMPAGETMVLTFVPASAG